MMRTNRQWLIELASATIVSLLAFTYSLIVISTPETNPFEVNTFNNWILFLTLLGVSFWVINYAYQSLKQYEAQSEIDS